VLIAVLYVVAASANNSNIEIILYSVKWGGKEYKLITSAYPHVVTNVELYCVTHKYLDTCHTKIRATDTIV
jgi:hypothetical protein